MEVKKILVILLLAVLSACSGLDQINSAYLGLGKLSEETAEFDGETVVEVTPSYLYSDDLKTAAQVQMGSRWKSNNSDVVIIDLKTVGSYESIDGIKVNIAGEVQEFTTKSITSHDREYTNIWLSSSSSSTSFNSILMPWDYFVKMMESENVRIRTNYGASYYEDSLFSIEKGPYGVTAAKGAMIPFYQRVKEVRTQ